MKLTNLLESKKILTFLVAFLPPFVFSDIPAIEKYKNIAESKNSKRKKLI